MSFLGEIRRRKIFQVAAVYAVVAWLLVQIVATVEKPLSLPDWVDTFIILLLAVGFPVTLVMSWGFNLTAEGLVKDMGENPSAQNSGKRIEYVLIGLLVLAVAWIVYRVEFDARETISEYPDSAALPAGGVSTEPVQNILPNSIAVLPFENLSPDPDNAYFASGIHESTLSQLAKIRDLVVISRTSVMQYADNRPPIPEIANALNVETIMEGSVRYANGRVLITAQLIDAKTDAHLWSDEYNRELTDVFAVQAEVAKHIAAAMRVQLLPDEQARIENRPTQSAEAYESYLYALSLSDILIFPENRIAAAEMLKRAIEADPQFAEAYAGLAWAYYASPSDRHLAVEAAQKAIELDPASGRAYFVLGMSHRYYHDRQEEARAAFQRTVDLSPNDPQVLIGALRQLAEQSGEYADAIRIGERVVSIDPRRGNHAALGFIYMRAGDLAPAEKHMREGFRLDPGDYVDYLDFATVKYLSGDHDGAKEYLDRAAQWMPPGATLRSDYLAYLHGLLGDTETAKRFLAEQQAVIDNPGDDTAESLGWAALGTRDKETALRVWTETIESYINDGRPVSLGRITRFRDNWLNDPMLEEPEFVELRRQLGFGG